MTGSINSWNLAGQAANLACGTLRASLQVDRPAAGLTEISFAEVRQPAARLLRWLPGTASDSPPLRFADSYVRGIDLVATYAANPPEQIQPQIYWRAREESAWNAAGVELIVSVQTSLLDSRPEAVAISEVGYGEVWRLVEPDEGAFSYIAMDDQPLEFTAGELNVGVVVVRPADAEFSYAEMIHPTDFVAQTLQVDLSGEPILKITSRLFPERLEKGVIRRSRICGWFLPREYDLQIAAELYRRFVNEPPPLTA